MNEVDARKDESDAKRAKAGTDKVAAGSENDEATVVQGVTEPLEPGVTEQQEAPAEPAAAEVAS
jgi:hypothetical protein